jgi:amino acid adenylation domain-containing protein
MFVLLDPTLPHARIRYILDDVQAGLLVTSEEYLLMVKAVAGQNSWLNMDEVDTGRCAENPDIALTPGACAYVLYTSGSTGRPKGIVENHRNLLHYIMTETNDLHICAEDRLTFLASQGRDIFRAVLNGAAVYPLEVKQEGFSGLARWLIEEEITIYNSVASAFRHFVNTLTGIEEFPHLRLIKLMGETVYRQDVELYQKHFSAHCIFVNWYGPNETGLLSHYLIDKTMRLTNSVVPVGYAVKDKEVQVWDEDDKEAPVGQPGEIVVRSRYLSPGYWRRPDLTDGAFLRDSSESAERLYRTGDMGSMGPDGCLIHLGRKDFQVKIRGHRVEVAEVETALLDLDGVREAVVLAREDAPGERCLVAYVVPTGARPPTTSSLRRALTAKLPDYMIPSAFVFLDALPLIGIGKIDRRALPDPGKLRPDLDSGYVSPRTPVESDLEQIWAEILSLDRMGIHDNFFDLGGHSLAATRIVSRVIKKFQLEIPLQSLFQSPTIAKMAAVIMENQARKPDQTDLQRILTDLESLSDEDVKRLLASQDAPIKMGDDHE